MPDARKALRRPVVLLAVVVAAFFLLFQQGEITVSDGQEMYQTAKALADHGSLVIPAQYAQGEQLGPDGKHYSKYGIGLSLLAVPPYLLGKAAASVVGHTDKIEQAFVASLMPLIAAGLAVALFLLSRRLGARERSSILIGVGAVLGTFALPYGKDFFAEPLTALFLTLAFERALARRPLAAGALLGAACLTRPQSFILVLIIVPLIAWRQGPRAGVLSLAPLVATGAIQAFLNNARYGSPLKFGYGGETFSNDPFSGLAHLMVDPRKSVIIFAPVILLLPPALLLLWRKHREACLILTSNLLVLTLLSAAWDSWQGGWSWGPRLLLPGVLPALAALAIWLDARAINRRMAIAAFALGFAVSASTIIVPTQAQQLDRPAPKIGPAVIRQIELIGPTVSYTYHHALARSSANNRPGAHRRFVNTWQVGVAREIGRSGFAVALLLSTFLAALLIAATWRLIRACREPPSLTPALAPVPSASRVA